MKIFLRSWAILYLAFFFIDCLATCQNEDPNCWKMAENGDCETNPGFMMYSCKESCHVCATKVDCWIQNEKPKAWKEKFSKNPLSKFLQKRERFRQHKDMKMFTINLEVEWSPLGAQRFIALVEEGFYDGTALFRAVPDFLVQFGISPNRALEDKWFYNNIPDDPHMQDGFQRGQISFAGGSKDSRSTQIFVALKKSSHLGTNPWETPFGYLDEKSMEVFYRSVNFEYGDVPPWGKGPNPQEIKNQGYKYLHANYPHLTYIRQCKVRKEIDTTKELKEEKIGGSILQTGEEDMQEKKEVQETKKGKEKAANAVKKGKQSSMYYEKSLGKQHAMLRYRRVGVILVTILLVALLFKYIYDKKQSPKDK